MCWLGIENLSKRVKTLEDRLYDFSFPRGTTKVSSETFTGPELELAGRFERLVEKYGGYGDIPDAVLGENHELLAALEKIYWLRTLDLFDTVVVKRICKKPFEEFLFYTRFFHFMRETQLLLERNRKEDLKLKELFGAELDDDSKEIPDTDPRWAVFKEYDEQIEVERKAALEKEDVEMWDSAFKSMEKSEEESAGNDQKS